MSLENPSSEENKNEQVNEQVPNEIERVLDENPVVSAEEQAERVLEKENKVSELKNEINELFNEKLNPEEDSVLQTGIKLHQAMSQHDKAFNPMIARGQQEQLSSIYGENWKNLSEEFDKAYDALPGDSKNKVHEKLNSELDKMGLLKKSEY